MLEEAQNTFGGMERKDVPEEDFAGKNKSFPIVTPADVSDAAASMGRAGADNYSTDELKVRIIKIAKRKGADFVKALPQKWQDEMSEAEVGDITEMVLAAADMLIEGQIALREAATLKARVRSAINALRTGLSDKTLPKALLVAMDQLSAELTKTWGDLAADADSEGDAATATEAQTYDEWYAKLSETDRNLLEDHIHGLKSALDKERARRRGGEQLDGDFVPLSESALTESNISLKVIRPGWGSSGYYPADVLERDGPSVFKKGTKMYWNHPSKSSETDRPERDLHDLAAVLETDAVYRADGKDGPGLYADAKVFGKFAPALKELAPHIGVSIRAMGKVQAGEAEGKKGPVIEAITGAQSIDFVTAPGAGGKVLELFEAARDTLLENENQFTEATMDDKTNETLAQVKDLQSKLTQRDAKDLVTEALAKSTLIETAKVRISQQVLKSVPLSEAGELDKDALNVQVTEAVKRETEYLAEVLKANPVRGMGQTEPPNADEAKKAHDKLIEAFKFSYLNQGMSEEDATKYAAIAAEGR
jgi:hypothetical protein